MDASWRSGTRNCPHCYWGGRADACCSYRNYNRKGRQMIEEITPVPVHVKSSDVSLTPVVPPARRKASTFHTVLLSLTNPIQDLLSQQADRCEAYVIQYGDADIVICHLVRQRVDEVIELVDGVLSENGHGSMSPGSAIHRHRRAAAEGVRGPGTRNVRTVSLRACDLTNRRKRRRV